MREGEGAGERLAAAVADGDGVLVWPTTASAPVCAKPTSASE